MDGLFYMAAFCNKGDSQFFCLLKCSWGFKEQEPGS